MTKKGATGDFFFFSSFLQKKKKKKNIFAKKNEKNFKKKRTIFSYQTKKNVGKKKKNAAARQATIMATRWTGNRLFVRVQDSLAIAAKKH